MRAGSTMPTWSASFPARTSLSTPRTPSLRSQAATSGPLRSPWVHDACALRARSRRCPKASCGRVDRLRGALSLREPGSRASHDGEQGACSLHARRRFRGALLRACAPAARCYNEVHRRGVFAVARHRHAGALHPRAQRGDASAGGRPVACDQGLGNRRAARPRSSPPRATWERAASWSPVPPREAGPFRFGKWKTRSYGSSRARRLPRLRALPPARRSVPSKLDPYKPVIHQ